MLPQTQRYELGRPIGRGSAGLVYEALDTETGDRVAIKVLRDFAPEAILRLKNEFRALSDIVHPNLVDLHELIAHTQQAFVVMELVKGCHFIDYVRPAPDGERDRSPKEDETLGVDASNSPDLSDTLVDRTQGGTTVERSGEIKAVAAPRQAVAKGPDVDRLRPVLRQLAEAIGALHEAGKLHRDLKPSNVMVTNAGQVVVLDFGLVSRVASGSLPEKALVGTVGYMSPEQAIGGPLTFASDWYSFGAILYEALTGHLVFTGSLTRVVRAKQDLDPTPPEQVASDIPMDLAQLCIELLARDPEARPPADEIIRRLGGRTTDENLRVSSPKTLVGRDAHLAELQAAHRRSAETGGPVLVMVSGPAGSGKTTLVERFAQSIGALTLSGRCYRNEFLPYKGFDGMVDQLASSLERMTPAELLPHISDDVGHLIALFPVLGRVKILRRQKPSQIADRQERRRRAFSALLELLEALSVPDRPAILVADDVHWADSDSASLLGTLMRGTVPLLLILSYRDESSPFLSAARRALDLARASVVHLELDELGEEDCEALLTEVAGEDKVRKLSLESLWNDCTGNPLLVAELGHHLREATKTPESISLDELVHERARELSPEARRILEVVAVAGRPTPLSVITTAADASDTRESLGALARLRLVKVGGFRSKDLAEPFHERTRAIIDGELDEARRTAIHQRLFEVLSHEQTRDPEALRVHAVGAHMPPEAVASLTAEAAQAAHSALAFERAATLFEAALALPGFDNWERVDLQMRLGLANENSGRGEAASRAYLTAAELAAERPALAGSLRRRAAEQLLVCGLIDRGLRLLGEALAHVEMGLFKVPEVALASILRNQGRLYLRGFDFHVKKESEVRPEVLQKLDVCWAGVRGLSMVDPIQGLDFHMRYLLLALEAGEERRIALGLASHASHAAFDGQSAAPVCEKTLALATEIGDRLADPYTQAVTALSAGVSSFLLTRFKDSHRHNSEARAALLEHCTNVYWEVSNTYLFSLWSLSMLGDIRAAASLLRRAQQTADESGNLYLITNLRCTASFFVHAANDDVEAVHMNLDRIGSAWSKRGYHFQHWEMMLTTANLALYTGQPREAWSAVRHDWKRIARSLLMRGELIRVEAYCIRGRCAVAVASTQEKPDSKLLRVVEKCAKKLKREAPTWAEALRLPLSAARAAILGDRPIAERLLRDAVSAFEAEAMLMHVAAVQQVLGGEYGDAEAAAKASAWMAKEAVVDPWRLTRLLIPGPWGP